MIGENGLGKNGKENLEEKTTKEDFENYLKKLKEDSKKYFEDSQIHMNKAIKHKEGVKEFIENYKRDKARYDLDFYLGKDKEGGIFYYYRKKD